LLRPKNMRGKISERFALPAVVAAKLLIIFLKSCFLGFLNSLNSVTSLSWKSSCV
jgi:hypothetical protein